MKEESRKAFALLVSGTIAIILIMQVFVCIPAAAKEKMIVVFLETKESTKQSKKGKFITDYKNEFFSNGSIKKHTDLRYSPKEVTKYYYDDYGKLIRKEEGSGSDKNVKKYYYSNGGRNVEEVSGQILQEPDAFYRFTKSGLIKEKTEYDYEETIRHIFYYNKKDKLIMVKHYNGKGVLRQKDEASYNKKGWLKKVVNTRYDEKGKFFNRYTNFKYSYKTTKKYIYRKVREIDDEGYPVRSTEKYSKRKRKSFLGTDPFEMPYYLIGTKEKGEKKYSNKYKYRFYKKGRCKAALKQMTEYYEGRFYEAKKYKYKKVRMSLVKARRQEYIRKGIDESVLYVDSEGDSVNEWIAD